MPRFLFHLHAGEGRANADNSGQHLPDRDAAREMARRIAGRLVAWNLEPVSWLDYQVQVTDEAGAIVFELPLAQAVGQSWDDRLRGETGGGDADLENESLATALGLPNGAPQSFQRTSKWLAAPAPNRVSRVHWAEQRLA